MKHYLVVLEEKRFLKETYYSTHFVGKAEGNAIPPFSLSKNENFFISKIITDLEKWHRFENLSSKQRTVIDKEGHKELVPFPQQFLTLEEIVLNDFARITFIKFDSEGKFKEQIVFERTS